MPQLILPLIPTGATQINGLISVWRDDNQWTYFVGILPIYYHKADDRRMFCLIIAQLINCGACRPIHIMKTFSLSKSFVIRAMKKLRHGGVEAFFEKRQGRQEGTILKLKILEKIQSFIDQGHSRRETAAKFKIKYDTLCKAINDKRLHEPKHHKEVLLTKSSRNAEDAAAALGMGTACTRVAERVLSSLGQNNGAPVHFETCLDVPKGGVLCALPFLLANGLLNDVEKWLGKIKGYYTPFQVLLLLGFMALCRVKTVEKLGGQAPGEFGKLLGLDRIPEARCLRQKLDGLSGDNASERWAAHLSAYWMNNDPEAVGTLYIDGHVRVYHGHLAKVPRHYVSRERLCLRGITDYWVNDAIGRPFFVVEKGIDPGLIKTLQADIVPRLLKDIPNQPTDLELAAQPFLCRFILVFDREGYSPAFFGEMWREHRIACITYHKHPAEPWPVAWFTENEVTMPDGEVVKMRLCEMGSFVGSGKSALWMREIRKLTDSGHQTSVISTAFELPHTLLAARMFTRWCQENFFRYMMQHFDIDQIIEYGIEPFPDTATVVNPAWRELNRQRNALENKLRYRRAGFAEITMHPETEDHPEKYAKWLRKKSDLFEEVEHYEHQLKGLKANLKETQKHIILAQLDEKDKINRLLPGRKRLMDTIHMIAYRSETAMAGLLIGTDVDLSVARQLLQDLFVTEADILPDYETNRLHVRIHSASRPAANRALMKLLAYLNQAELVYPGTNLRLIYKLVGANNEQNGVQGVRLSSGR